MLQLPTNGVMDSLYNIRMWLTCAEDPNQTNDSNSFTVESRYQLQPPANVDTTTLYLTEGYADVEEEEEW